MFPASPKFFCLRNGGHKSWHSNLPRRSLPTQTQLDKRLTSKVHEGHRLKGAVGTRSIQNHPGLLFRACQHLRVGSGARRLGRAVSLHFSTNTLSRKWSSAAGGKQLVSDVSRLREATDWPEEITWSQAAEGWLGRLLIGWQGTGRAGALGLIGACRVCDSSQCNTSALLQTVNNRHALTVLLSYLKLEEKGFFFFFFFLDKFHDFSDFKSDWITF